jgi:hypothetical protein
LNVGTMVSLDGVEYTVTHQTAANYRAVEGELPFQFWDKTVCQFIDLRSWDGRFLTVDFTEATPLLFGGRMVEFDKLNLKNLRQFEGW